MEKKITLLDGAVGTSLWEKIENSKDKVPVWRYNIEKPELVRQLHTEMADAGAEIMLANTFGANRGMVSRSLYTVEQVVREGVKLCRETVGNRVKVAMGIGPLTGLLEPYGDITEDECEEIYTEMIDSGMKERPDIIYLQTFIDAAMLGIAAKCARKYDVPLFCSMTFEKVGKTMMGNSVADMVTELKDYQPDAIGLNCNLVPTLALPVLEMFRNETDLPLIFKPNAGKPIMLKSGANSAELSADAFVEEMLPAVEKGASYIGGCCGANAVYIRKLAEALKQE